MSLIESHNDSPAQQPNEARFVSAAARRMAAFRERQKRDARLIPLEIFETEISALVKLGLLDAEKRKSKFAVTQAMYDFLDAQFARLQAQS